MVLKALSMILKRD
jgi:P-type Ca2+ transporter type 2B